MAISKLKTMGKIVPVLVLLLVLTVLGTVSLAEDDTQKETDQNVTLDESEVDQSDASDATDTSEEASDENDADEEVAGPAPEDLPPLPAGLANRYKSVTSSINLDNIEKHIRELSKYDSRMVGYEGCEKAGDYVLEQFKAVGLEDVKTEEFKVSVPIDEGSKLVIDGTEYPIYGIWPNLVRTSQLPPEGIKVHLIDAGKGRLPDFDGKDVEDCAALIDFNSGTEWLNAPRLGAKAVIFVEPEETMRGEGEAKFSAIPVSMPRFWISKENAEKIKRQLAQIDSEFDGDNLADKPKLEATIHCEMPWEKVASRNIIGVIPGSDPELADEWIVLHSHYDSTSIVPSLAPGAESTCGIAAMLELARLFKQPEFAPRRSVMFLATSAHFQSLAGMREYFSEHIDEYRSPGNMDSFYAWLNNNWPENGAHNMSDYLFPAIGTIIALLLVLWFWSYLKKFKESAPGIALLPILLAVLCLYLGYASFNAFSRGFDYYIPDPPNFYVWAGLDLTSQTEGVGLFYKGYFYDYREDIRGKFSDLASRSRENSERVAATLGFFEQRKQRFSDGVNPVDGKNWRNFVPGKIALDSEVVTLAGGKGVSFVSTDDGRLLVDTPFDTVEKINFDNLKEQVDLIACLIDHWFRDSNSVLDEEYQVASVAGPKTIEVENPLTVGYVQGVYTNEFGRGTNYLELDTEKELPESLASGKLQLTKELPDDAEKVYVHHKPITKLGMPEGCAFTRMGLQGGFSTLSGNVVMYDQKRSFVPNLPIKDCLAVLRSPHKSFMGVRANIVDKTAYLDEENQGYFKISGIAPMTAYGGPKNVEIGAYKLDKETGMIINAPDQGTYGQFFPTSFSITTGHKDMPIVVFHCKSTSVYDLIDPQTLSALSSLSIFDGDNHAAPRQFGSAVAVPEPMNPFVEDMAVIFTEDTKKTGQTAVTGKKDEVRRNRIQLVMSAGPATNRLLLLNSVIEGEYIKATVEDGNMVKLEEPVQGNIVVGAYTNQEFEGDNYYKMDPGDVSAKPSTELTLGEDVAVPADIDTLYMKLEPKAAGYGYDFTDGGIFRETAFHVATDMWKLDEHRLRTLEEKGVMNEGLNSLHATALTYLEQAENARKSFNYSVFDSFCRAAWGYEARAYPDVTATSQDVVNGVIFYLFLMLPFAFFAERLFFAFPNLVHQIMAFFVIFLIVFAIFYFVHPAFQIAGNAMIILIAFVMLALAILVIFVVTNKFEEQLKQLNKSASGIHKADIGRMSVAAAAFSLGISNMRRRKARTVLTCVTLILLTFTVLSFTSIVSVLRFNKVPATADEDTHVYNGIMIRTASWDPLQEIAYRLLKDEFGNKQKGEKAYPVAPRAWFYGTILGEQSFLTLKKGDNTYDARAAIGLAPEEAEVMEYNGVNKDIFVAGDWFGYKDGKKTGEEPDPYSIIIPSVIAEDLGVTPEQVGKAKVDFAGAKYTVQAIIDNERYKRVKDLDNETLTPVDFILMSKQGGQQQQGQGGDTGFREYTHLEPDNVFIVPYKTLISLGGNVRSIAIKFDSAKEVQEKLDSLMPRLGLNLYAGIDGSIYRYSSIGSSASKGFSNVFVPVLIAALIVLNTMLGSVYERVKEIGIFSSIGLAPNHIAVLFIAESMVYANLGAVSGYVLGQTANKILTSTNLLPGLYLNFSSMSAVVATVVVVGVVLLSVLYPARKASEVATPSVDRSWKVPDPEGDDWKIMLPFAVTGLQAKGVNTFLKEWFEAYEEYSIGDFVTQDVASEDVDTEFGVGYQVTCKTWLAPFDLGVSQIVTLQTVPTAMEDVYEVYLYLHRESGDVSNWKRVNRRFLNTLRKQFLIWRTLKQEDRERYLNPEAASTTA